MFLFSCKNSNTTEIIPIVGYDEKSTHELPIDSFFILPLESNNKCMLSGINKIDFIDSFVVIQSSNGVFSFNNKTGRYYCSYGEKGHGVGEYIKINTFYINKENKEIHIVDGVRNQILAFNLYGEYINNIKFPKWELSLYSNVEKYNSDELFGAKYIYNNENVLYAIINPRKKVETIITQTPFQSENSQEYFGRHSFCVRNDTIKALVPYSNYVFYSSQKDLTPKWVIETKKDILSSKELERIKNFGIFSYVDYRNQGKFVGFTDFFETSKYFLLAFYNLDYFFVNKDNYQGFMYNESQNDDALQDIPLVDIKTTKDEFLVGTIESYRLKKWNVSPTTTNKNLKILKQTIDSISSDGNPVLFFYGLR